MKIRESSLPSALGGVSAPQTSPGVQGHKRSDAPAARSIADVTSVAGLDEAELSPAVRQALNVLMSEVERLRGELDRARRRIEYLEHLADEDTLVPVANRRAFVRELSRMVSFAERYGLAGCVLYFDVNHLKQINDRHGHACGDAALRTIAKVLVDNVRESDIVGRLGGDEFGVILAQADERAAREKAAALASLIASTPFEWDGEKIELSVAYGLQPLSGSADAALDAADRAMYRQKHERDEAAAHGVAAESSGP